MCLVHDISEYIVDHVWRGLMALATDQHSTFHFYSMFWTVWTALPHTMRVQRLRHVIVPLAKCWVLTTLPWEVVGSHCHTHRLSGMAVLL